MTKELKTKKKHGHVLYKMTSARLEAENLCVSWVHWLQRNFWPQIMETRLLWRALRCGTPNNKKSLWVGGVCMLCNQVSPSKVLCHWSKQSEWSKWRRLRAWAAQSLASKISFTEACCKSFEVATSNSWKGATMCSAFIILFWEEFNIKKMIIKRPDTSSSCNPNAKARNVQKCGEL